MVRHIPLLAIAIASFTSRVAAIEIESKDGRKIEASIISADTATVTIRKEGGSNTTVKRETLSLETNKKVDEFLKEKRDSSDDTNRKLSAFETKIGGKTRRVSMWLPTHRENLKPSGSSIQINGGSGSNHLSMVFHTGTSIATAEKKMNDAKASLLASANRKTKSESEKLDKIVNVEKKRYGTWDGYVLEGWSDRQNEDSDVLMFGNRAYFVNGEFGVEFTFQFGKDGAFKRRQMEEIIGSVIIETVE